MGANNVTLVAVVYGVRENFVTYRTLATNFRISDLDFSRNFLLRYPKPLRKLSKS